MLKCFLWRQMVTLIWVILCFHSLKIVSEEKFNPYEDNGGNILSIAARDGVVIAADKLLSSSKFVETQQSKIFQIGKSCFFAGTGCWADVTELSLLLQKYAQKSKKVDREDIKSPAIAFLLSQLLYSRRTFPYLCFSCVAGIDSQGHGCLYSYDPIGSFERVPCAVQGKSRAMILPLLDQAISTSSDFDSLWKFDEESTSFVSTGKEYADISCREATSILVEQLISVGWNDNYNIGDNIELKIMRKGVTSSEYETIHNTLSLRYPPLMLRKNGIKTKFSGKHIG